MGLDHEEMLQEIKKMVSEQMDTHEKRMHDIDVPRDFGTGGTVTTRELVEGHFSMKSEMAELANAMLGTPKSDFMGGGRNHDGFIHTVRELAKSRNEVRLKLPASVWVAIITTIGLLGVAVIGLFDSVP